MSNVSPGSTNTYDCNGMEGRYINIVIPGQARYLSLCEVAVTGQPLKIPLTAGDFFLNIPVYTASWSQIKPQ